MHMIQLTRQIGNELQDKIIYRSRNYDKAVSLFLKIVNKGLPVVLVSKSNKPIKQIKGGKA